MKKKNQKSFSNLFSRFQMNLSNRCIPILNCCSSFLVQRVHLMHILRTNVYSIIWPKKVRSSKCDFSEIRKLHFNWKLCATRCEMWLLNNHIRISQLYNDELTMATGHIIIIAIIVSSLVASVGISANKFAKMPAKIVANDEEWSGTMMAMINILSDKVLSVGCVNVRQFIAG